uniref:Uncharacterized protein n=1 Tax=Kalanchoe fedtschenkoi TaxID=63787 RepID=A0A7N0T8X1_KALFE
MHPSLNLISLLKRCSDFKNVRQIHGVMVSTGLEIDSVFLTKLIEVCSSFGFYAYVYSLFSARAEPDVYLYNSVIKALSSSSDFAKRSVMIYGDIRGVGLQPDTYTVPFVLRAVSRLPDVCAGRQVHCGSFVSGLSLNVHVATGLVQMYWACGCGVDARKVFDEMRAFDVFLWNAMVAGYVKVGDLDSASGLFEIMPARNVISWTSMISGYAQMNCPSKAIDLFRRMQLDNVRPDEVAMLAALSACANLGEIDLGEWIISYIDRHRLQKTEQISNARIDMHAKSGNIQKALEVFEDMKVKSVVSWTTMIAGLAMNGLGNKALEMFEHMEKAGVEPNGVTFLSVLSACSHSGLVDLGWWYLDLMDSRYGIKPTVEHLGCMVDLLGRAGHLQEAEKLIKEMPYEGNKAMWGSVLNSARVHGDADLAKRALNNLLVLEPNNSGNFMLMSNTLASHGKWNEARMIRKIMKETGVKKMAGGSFIEVEDQVYGFFAGDGSHPQYDGICEVANNISDELKMLNTVVHNHKYEMCIEI